MAVAKRLETRQVQNLGLRSAIQMLEQQKTTRFAEFLLKQSKNLEIQEAVIDRLVKAGLKGNQRAVNLLIALSRKGVRVTKKGIILTEEADFVTRKVILEALQDLAVKRSHDALKTLQYLAKSGDPRAQIILKNMAASGNLKPLTKPKRLVQKGKKTKRGN